MWESFWEGGLNKGLCDHKGDSLAGDLPYRRLWRAVWFPMQLTVASAAEGRPCSPANEEALREGVEKDCSQG